MMLAELQAKSPSRDSEIESQVENRVSANYKNSPGGELNDASTVIKIKKIWRIKKKGEKKTNK